MLEQRKLISCFVDYVVGVRRKLSEPSSSCASTLHSAASYAEVRPARMRSASNTPVSCSAKNWEDPDITVPDALRWPFYIGAEPLGIDAVHEGSPFHSLSTLSASQRSKAEWMSIDVRKSSVITRSTRGPMRQPLRVMDARVAQATPVSSR